MEREIAENQARDLKIDLTQIVREYWEIIILKGLFDSPEGKFLIFKGGTALRLVYGSPRFSQDLDFSLISDRLKGKFESLIKKIISPIRNLLLQIYKKNIIYTLERLRLYRITFRHLSE